MAPTALLAAAEPAAYLLKNIDPALWARFKARSEEEGIPMRLLLLRLIAAYTDDVVELPRRQPKRRARS